MRITAKCDTCHRKFLLSQIGPDSETAGRCPFCGARFARHYAPVLGDAVRDAEETSARLVQVLGRLQAMETGFELELEEYLDDLHKQVHEHEGRPSAAI